MVLDIDPLHEVTQLELLWRERSGENHPLLRRDAAAVRLDELALTMAADRQLLGLLDEAGVTDEFGTVLESMASSELVRQCSRGVKNVNGPDWATFADCFAEAVIAETFRIMQPPSPRQYSPEFRDALAARMLDLLHGRHLGLWGIGATVGLGATAAAGKVVQHWRGPFSTAAQPFVGDIFRYLAFGEPLRQFIANTVRQAGPPVTLVGHSLGGIACLDLLALNPGLPVARLVTVGSQGSQLYRMGALPGLRDNAVLPAGFPRWTNVYSRYDLLSYLAAPVFGPGGVSDVEISGVKAMPAAHSAYFEQDALYELVVSSLDPEIAAAGRGAR